MRRAFDEAGGLARGQALLGLAGELRVGHLHARARSAARSQTSSGRELHAARQQVAELAELAQRVGQAGAQAVDVGAVLRGRDQVDVALLHQLVRLPASQATAQSTSASLPREVADERLGGSSSRPSSSPTGSRAGRPRSATRRVAAGLVGQADGQARAEHRLGAQQVLERAQAEFRRVEVLRVRPEAQAVPVLRLPTVPTIFSFDVFVAVREGHAVLVAVALDVDLELAWTARSPRTRPRRAGRRRSCSSC